MKINNKKVLITGISGQDGSYLSEHLLNKNCEVHGMIRRHSISDNQDSRIQHLLSRIKTYYGDMTDESSLYRIVNLVKPDFIFNLAAQSHVRISVDVPKFTGYTNAIGVLNILEIMREIVPNSRLYQASSSEMFGNSIDIDNYQRITTPMLPVSPYGISKLYAYHMVRHYRNGHNMFCSNGILFNHESPRRGENFVTSKTIKTAVGIKYGLTDKLVLGNLDSKRDWGHSKDYTRAMIMILENDTPDDFIVAMGENHSIRDMCKYVFDKLGMNYKDYVVQDEKYMRPEELKELKGDSSKIRTELGWVPEYTFETLMDEIIEYWIDKVKNGNNRLYWEKD